MILQEFAFPPRAKNTLESRSGKGECGLFESLAPGGAFILVEKILGATAKLDEAFVNLFLNIKRENGYSESQIDRKRLSLEGVLVPVTARWNEELLYQEGFTSVDCFWRHLNFAGWVAVKP